MSNYLLKRTSVIILATVIVVGGGSIGLQSFTRSIYNQRSCEWANIDNIELHAHIDIPKVTFSACEYNQASDTKMSRFDIDLQHVDLESYIERNKFTKLTSPDSVSLSDFYEASITAGDVATRSDLYYTKGTHSTESWQTLLDSTNGRLWVTIKY